MQMRGPFVMYGGVAGLLVVGGLGLATAPQPAPSVDPSLCFRPVTVLERGKPKTFHDGMTRATLTPVLRGGEVDLPLRYVQAALGWTVVMDGVWNYFHTGRTHYRLGAKETHEPALMLGVKNVEVTQYDVAPSFRDGRVYVPLKRLPFLARNAVKDADGTLKLVPPAGCTSK